MSNAGLYFLHKNVSFTIVLQPLKYNILFNKNIYIL